MYLTKSIGSSVFFVVFPLLVVISCDEKGQGLLLVKEERKTKIEFVLFSWAMQMKDWVLDVLTLRIMRNRLSNVTSSTAKSEKTEDVQ